MLEGTVANQLFRRTFRNSKFFETHVHLGTLTFQKILNHKNFLEKLDLQQRLKKIFVTLLLLSLVSCGFQVIYKDDDKNKEVNFSYEQELAAIRIKKIRTKLDQDLKNNLYDALNPDYLKAEPKYFLSLTTAKSVSTTFISATGASGRNRVILNVKYELHSLETGEMISEGSTVMNDNYDVTSNRFGTYTADEYVTSNLTKVIAKNIRNSLVNDLIEMNKRDVKNKSGN